MKQNVFVIGGNHHNILGVIRSLGERGIKPYVIIQSEEESPYVRLSKYIQHYWIVKKDNEVLNLLRQEGMKLNKRAVLIICADGMSSLVDIHYDELKQWFFLPGSIVQGRITELMDKEVMSKVARETGLHVPQSSAEKTREKHAVSIPMPWIVKPLMSKNGSKSDIECIFNEEEWQNYCSRHDSLVQVQQLIEKDYEYQLIGLSLNGGNEVVIPGYSFVIRSSTTTNTGFLHYMPLDDSLCDVVAKGREFIRKTGYSGLFSLEFLKGKDGEDYFMEINFRNDGNAICVTAAGVNLPYIWYLYNVGGDYHKEIDESSVHSVYVMPEFADISLLWHRKLNLFVWLKDIYRTDRFMEYDQYDKAPFWQLFNASIKKGTGRIITNVMALLGIKSKKSLQKTI